ncbi:MAG: hypothetical protein ABSF45_26565 [Terriglobia bacterium]
MSFGRYPSVCWSSFSAGKLRLHSMNLHQAGATLAEVPVILGEAAPAGTVLGADRAEPGLAGVAPTQHGGRVG